MQDTSRLYYCSLGPSCCCSFTLLITVSVLALIFASVTRAEISVYFDRTAMTACSELTTVANWPNTGFVGNAFQQGTVHLSSPGGQGFYVGTGLPCQWTTLLTGNQIAINEAEDLDITLDPPVFGFGFDFVEPTMDSVGSCYPACEPSCPCMDSTFHLTLKNGESLVGQFDFNAPNDTAFFVGLLSTQPFNRIAIRDVTATCDDEFFGDFYAAAFASACAVHSGDMDGSGSTDVTDTQLMVAALLSESTECVVTCPGDFNNNGIIDGGDIQGFVNALLSQ